MQPKMYANAFPEKKKTKINLISNSILKLFHIFINNLLNDEWPEKAGDTNLIIAAKAGHKTIVDALIKRYADLDTKVSIYLAY